MRALTHSCVSAMKKYTVKHLLAAAVLSAICSICLILSLLVPTPAALWLCVAGAVLTIIIGVLMVYILSRRVYSTAVRAMSQMHQPRRTETEHNANFLVLCDDALTVVEDSDTFKADLRFIKQIKQDGRSCTLDQFIHPDDLPRLREQISNSHFLVPVVTDVRMLAGDLSGDLYVSCRCRSLKCPYKNFALHPAVRLTFTLAASEPLSSSRTADLLKTFSAAAWEYNIATDMITYTPVSAPEVSFSLHGHMLMRYLNNSMILHPDFRSFTATLGTAFMSGDEDIHTELKLMDASNDYRWYALTGTRVHDENGKVVGYSGQLRNTDNGSGVSENAFDPDLDPLTRLLNRHGMERSFSRLVAGPELQSCAFLLIDIDGFSDITSRLGKHFGDALLVEVAGIIRSNIDEYDLACRVTRDIFALLLINPKAGNEVLQQSELIAQAISHIRLDSENTEKLSCCIGVAYSEWNAIDYEALYYQADTALAFARSNGAGHCEVYYDGLDKILSSRDIPYTDPMFSDGQTDTQPGGDFLSRVVEVLSEARELSSSINIVLSLIGHKYNLERCEILEFSDDYQSAHSSYHWTHDYQTSSEPVQCTAKLLEEVVMLSPDTEYSFCGDIEQLAKAHPRIAAFYRRNNIASFIHVPIRDGGNTSGLLCYGAKKGAVVFTNEIIREIVLISKIMAGSIIRVRNIARINRMSSVDSLTGCMTMNRFVLEANRMINQNSSQPYVLAYSDIDRFKFINESFGYPVGDRVLMEFVEIINGMIHEDELLGRIDADKFIAMLRYDDQLTSRLSECDRRISRISALRDGQYKIPLRCGISQVDPTEELSHIIDRANLARKSLKNVHVSTFVFYNEGMKNSIIQRKEIEDTMSESLENGEFVVYLQPKFSLEDDCIVGAEALVRWIRPGHGVQSPDDFIPIFEENGFIVRLDFYVLEKVCQKLRRDIDSGLTPYPISVNFSRLHLTRRDFTEKLKSCLEKYQIDPKYIELEITESALVGNEDFLVGVMDALHDVGLTIAMDDFGSGYSTLNLLKKLPVDILKIDKAFFTGSGSERERLIIENVVTMAKALDICVVSEGVETREQASFLRRINCDIAQGYLYAHPMDLDTYESTYQRI